jgi:hypothetical protein
MLAAIIVGAVSLLVIGATWAMRKRRQRDESLIRRWADEQGYAVLRIHGPMPSLTALFWIFLIPITWFLRLAGAQSYPTFVQDDEGGELSFEVTIRMSSERVEVRQM